MVIKKVYIVIFKPEDFIILINGNTNGDKWNKSSTLLFLGIGMNEERQIVKADLNFTRGYDSIPTFQCSLLTQYLSLEGVCES